MTYAVELDLDHPATSLFHRRAVEPLRP
jgi:hypothetical protein